MHLDVKPRNVPLTLENEAFIAERIASGRFANASEVVRAGLRLPVDAEQRRDTRAGRAARRRNGDTRINPSAG